MRAATGARPATERGIGYVIAAVTIAVVGVTATLWRPLAPTLLPAGTDLALFDPALLDVVAAYRMPRYTGVVAATALKVLVPVGLLLIPVGRRLLFRVAGGRADAPWRGGLVAVAMLAATHLAVLPIALWIGFFHERTWGFYTAELGTWIADWLLGAVVTWVLAALTAAAALWAMRRWPATWPFRAAVAGTALAGVLVLAVPVVVDPLTMRTEPLADGALRTEVESIVDRAGYVGAAIVVGDASTRTTKVNAYVTGLGPTRRVVLYDTLLERSPEQVLAVVAHEIAHHRHRDIERMVLLGGAGLAIGLPLLRWLLMSGRARRLVAARGPTDPRLVAVAAAALAVAWAVTLPVTSGVSRQLETAADHAAMEITGDPETQVLLRRAAVVHDLADPTPPQWFERIFSSHPSPAARISAAVAEAERAGVELPPLDVLRREEEQMLRERLR